jgi:protein TonB
LILSIVLIVGLFALPKGLGKPGPDTASEKTIKMQHRKVVGYSQLTAPPPVEAIPSPPQDESRTRIVGQPKLATKKFLPPVVMPDAEIEQAEVIPTQQELKKVNPGKKTVEGDSIGAVDFSEYEEAVIELDIEMKTRPDSVEEKAAPPPPSPPPPPPPPPVTEEPPIAEKKEKIYTAVEIQPSFPGGEEALLQFLYDNVEYPQVAYENGIEGIVLLKMVIEADGSISNIEVMRDIGGGCAEEVIRVVKRMPKWTPGVQAGYKVRVSVVLPVQFELTTDS